MINIEDIPAAVVEEFFDNREKNPAKSMRVLLEACNYSTEGLSFGQLAGMANELMDELTTDSDNPLPKSSASTRTRRRSLSRR